MLTQLRLLLPSLMLLGLLTGSPQEKNAPDSVTISGATLEAPYFKLHYSLPQNWSSEDDAKRMEKNRKKHEERVKSLERETSRIVNAGAITTRVFWVYDLLVATPGAFPADEKFPLPYIHIVARERSNSSSNPGDYANDMAKLRDQAPFKVAVFQKPEKQLIAGQKFVRSGLAYGENHYESLYETVSGSYLLSFEFHGKSEQEVNDLAKTMESVKFDR
ncbi:MAG TPA: hypothetical protein VIB39_04595 [Candidatus Angelobacter sp.]|jgi:hypothetical protein